VKETGNMKSDFSIEEKVHEYYWRDDINCATTMLKTVSEMFNIELSQQVIDSAVGMHGAGKFGAQCGLVEGSLMLIGIIGRRKNLSDEITVKNCYGFADKFQKKFGSLNCCTLRPEGFEPGNPPHLCEGLTVKAVIFTTDFLKDI
jgi:C_GCAxxG_C_C family probable redox protein